jgi:phage baseplate assembly protein W
MLGTNKNTGNALTSTLDHVRQSITDILTTPLNTRVIRREYGSLLPELIDHPLNEKNILRLYAATATAVMRWEPRFRISQVSLLKHDSQLIIELVGSINDRTQQFSIDIGGRS